MPEKAFFVDYNIYDSGEALAERVNEILALGTRVKDREIKVSGGNGMRGLLITMDVVNLDVDIDNPEGYVPAATHDEEGNLKSLDQVVNGPGGRQ